MTQDRDAASERDSAGDESLSEAFWSVARQLRETSQKTLAPWDISPSHLRALRVLTRRGTMRLSELSDHLHIAPRSTTEVVDALESRDLVQRRPDPDDRRATLVELTEHGASVLDAIRGTEAERVFGLAEPGRPRPPRPHSPQAPGLIRQRCGLSDPGSATRAQRYRQARWSAQVDPAVPDDGAVEGQPGEPGG